MYEGIYLKVWKFFVWKRSKYIKMRGWLMKILVMKGIWNSSINEREDVRKGIEELN